MINFRYTTTKAAKYLVPTIVLAIALISCETEDLSRQLTNADFEIPEQIYAEEAVTLTGTTSESANVLWEISDGSVYTTPVISHVFRNSGNFTIKYSIVENDRVTDTRTKSVNVSLKGRTSKFDRSFRAIRGITSDENQIIIEGQFEGDENTVFLSFDNRLKHTGTYATLQDINETLIRFIQLDNLNLIVKNEQVYEMSSALKSTGNAASVDNHQILSKVIPYINGYIHFYLKSASTINIDYYDKSINKLWSKTIDASALDPQQYLFNIQNILYYLSFDSQTDKVYINKFKNISLSYQTESFSLGIPAEDREILFAINKANQNKLSLGVYSYLTNTTLFFEVDENCKLNQINETVGYLSIQPEIVLPDGSVIAQQPNKLVRYNNAWQVEKELSYNTSDFGIFQLGDNLNLIFENTSAGLRLSYTDKHLNTVVFE